MMASDMQNDDDDIKTIENTSDDLDASHQIRLLHTLTKYDTKSFNSLFFFFTSFKLFDLYIE